MGVKVAVKQIDYGLRNRHAHVATLRTQQHGAGAVNTFGNMAQ